MIDDSGAIPRETRAIMTPSRHGAWGLPRSLPLSLVLWALQACQSNEPASIAPGDGGGRTTMAESPSRESFGTVDHALGVLPLDSAVLTLGAARMAYRPVRDVATLAAGVIAGRIEQKGGAAGDSVIVPTHDLSVCQPFTDTPIPSQAGGVGNAAVWLTGVTTGPFPDATRRASLVLDRCRLEPRVQRMAQGGTVMVTSRDAMMSRLRFFDAADASALRTQITLNDAGQVVPNGEIGMRTGLVEVRDDLHPWVRAWIAVAPHPFVAITGADGAFRFDGVPEGTYTLVVWQEKLGVRTRVVRVTRGVETRVQLEY